jgi:hypothetical protein
MKPELRRRVGLAAGCVIGGAIVALLNMPGCETFHAPGPMNTGHAELACSACHREAPGSVRQQLQTVMRIWLDIDADNAAPLDVGYRAVTNTECLGCHDRPNDRHPAFRFLEPRFAVVREALHPEQCASCHREHAGTRITIAERTFCRHCHDPIALDRDPLDVPHRELVASQRWDSCLGCHDFHGNHASRPPQRLEDKHTNARIESYFDGGASPYGEPQRHATSKEVDTP